MRSPASNNVPQGIKAWIFPAVAGVVLAAALIITVSHSYSNSSALSAQESQIAELESQVGALIDDKTSAGQIAQALDAGAPSADVDASTARIKTDTALIEALAATMFTWDSHETYENARAALVTDHGVDQNDPLLSTLMPPGPANVDSSGKVYAYIDAAGLNSTMGDVVVTPAAVVADQYSYIAMVTVLAHSTDGSTTASVTNVVQATVDGDGQWVSIEGYATQMPIKTA